MGHLYQSILDTVGNTPVVKINNIGPEHVNLYVKIESFNPMASVKDRLALGVIEDAERRGELKPGQTVVEATSGVATSTLPANAVVQDSPGAGSISVI